MKKRKHIIEITESQYTWLMQAIKNLEETKEDIIDDEFWNDESLEEEWFEEARRRNEKYDEMTKNLGIISYILFKK